MRQGQHKSSRSRNRGRRPSSPLSRVFESNGPDVKVRGTAQHVADKYLQLARDAQSSGDPIMAENYYQHAEHYLRILAAANSYAQQSSGYQQGHSQYQQRHPGGDEEAYDEGDDAGSGAEDEQPVIAVPSRNPPPAEAIKEEHQEQPFSPAEEADGTDKTWGGPQPEFLRRGSAGSGNGSSRSSRPPRPPRAEKGPDEPAGSTPSARSESDRPAEPVTD